MRFPATARTFTDQGYLKVPGRVARTGIQEYTAAELGLDDRDPNDIIKVMRPASQVFDKDSLATYEDADVTLEHPPKMVDSATYKADSVGHVRSAGKKDGNFVVCDLIIKDKRAIDSVNLGKVQLSAGYTAVYDEAPKDADYDYTQSDIKINHVALCSMARGGSSVKLFDAKGEKSMKKVFLDSAGKRVVEIEDSATAVLIEDSIKSLTDSLESAKSELEALKTESAKSKEKALAEIDGLKEQLDSLKKDTSDEAFKQKLAAITKVTADARKVAGKDFQTDSCEALEIQRAALAKARPKVDWDAKTEAYVEAAFDQALESAKHNVADSSHKGLAMDMSKDQEVESSAYDAMLKEHTNAWKKTAGLEK